MNKTQKRLILLTTLGTVIVMLLSGCADAVNVSPCIKDVELVGFWHGVWHGMIAQFSFIGSLFSDEIAVYAINNNGGWYNFGFVGGLGVMVRLLVGVVKAIFNK